MPNASSIPGIMTVLAPFIQARQALNQYRANINIALSYLGTPSLDPNVASELQYYVQDYTQGEAILSSVESQIRNVLAEAGYSYDIGLQQVVVGTAGVLAALGTIIAGAALLAYAAWWVGNNGGLAKVLNTIAQGVIGGQITPAQGQSLISAAGGAAAMATATPSWLVPAAAVGGILLVVFMMTR